MNNKGTKIKIKVLPSENHSKAVEIPVKFSFKEPDFSFSLMRKSLVKFTAFILIVALNWAGLSAVIQTIAEFNDTEGSSQNIFVATTLDFSLNSPPDFSPVIMPDATSSRDISLTNNGILGFQYTVTTTNATGTLCSFLNLEAKLDGTTTYVGPLTSFNFNAGEFSTSTDDWQFTATLTSDDPSLQNQTCVFDFVFDGNQIEGAGFYDQEIIPNTITSGIWLKVVINKVYYDVDETHGGNTDQWKHEWIELYNPLSNEVNLKDWKICDNTDCKTIHPDVSIPALGFVLLSHDASTWQYWEIPDGVEKINLGGSPSHLALNNDADMLILKNDSNIILDQMNWGTATDTWSNYNDKVWDPGVTDVDEGHILARVPTGVDTDTVSDWKDLGLPQVTVIWPNGGQILYVGRTYAINWSATNQNGNNNLLTIDLWYSKDSGASWARIATSTENDGAYDWTIRLCLDDGHGGCYYTPSPNARIKVVAFGPENFMVQNWDMSDSDFCPPIDFGLLTPEEIEMLKEMGLMGEETVVPTEEQPVIISSEEAGTTTEEIATSTEETATPTEETLIPAENDLASNGSDSTINGNQENGGIIETVNEVIDAADGAIDTVVEGIVEEIIPDEEVNEPVESVEVQADNLIAENLIIEQAPVEETVVFEQAPAIEEQAVIVPDNNSSSSPSDGDPGDSGSADTGSADSGSADAGSTSVSGGEVGAVAEAAPADAAQVPAGE